MKMSSRCSHFRSLSDHAESLRSIHSVEMDNICVCSVKCWTLWGQREQGRCDEDAGGWIQAWQRERRLHKGWRCPFPPTELTAVFYFVKKNLRNTTEVPNKSCNSFNHTLIQLTEYFPVYFEGFYLVKYFSYSCFTLLLHYSFTHINIYIEKTISLHEMLCNRSDLQSFWLLTLHRNNLIMSQMSVSF